MANDEMIQQEVSFVGEKISELKHEIAAKMAKGGSQSEEAMAVRLEFLQILIDAFHSEKGVSDRVSVFGRRTGELALEYGASFDDFLKNTSRMRNVIWLSIKEVLIDSDVSVETIFEVARIINPLIDDAVYSFSSAYIESFKKAIQKEHDQFLTLSAPIVPLMEGTAVLPIIGGVDTERAELIMNKAMKEAGQRNITHLFMDLSGTPMVDTMVAYNIFKIIQSLDMVGVKTIIAGIRPEVAQTIISLGIDFSNIQTYSSLKQALSRHKVFAS
ncbi:STAS domain-containing protein [Virgibacillus kekensis]|uniref:STAS domain-containing protein n=1 Tax=Virgibacillus kekensis TaxID=202261 RepID=A0ABV9DPN8_9BACI